MRLKEIPRNVSRFCHSPGSLSKILIRVLYIYNEERERTKNKTNKKQIEDRPECLSNK